MKQLLLLLAASLLVFGCSREQATETGIVGDKPANAGRIRGVVRLKGNPPAPASEPITRDQQVCGKDVSLPRITLGKDGGVADTFVYLDGAPATSWSAPVKAILVDQKNCQYSPHMLAVPVGTKLEFTNSDTILHNVHGYQSSDEGPQTLFNIAQPERGQRSPLPAPLTKPGIISLSCEAGHPWMSGYVFVSESPYVAIAKNDGEFVIPDVPPGTYRIKMWHEGVTLKQNLKQMQRYEYEEPYEATQEVTVQPGAEAVVNFDLILR